MTFAIPMSGSEVAAASCVIRSALDAAVGALRSRMTAPAKVTPEERLSEHRLGQLVVPYALGRVAAVGALHSGRTAPAKVTGKKGLASRVLSANLERDYRGEMRKPG